MNKIRKPTQEGKDPISGKEIDENWFVFVVPGHNPSFAKGNTGWSHICYVSNFLCGPFYVFKFIFPSNVLVGNHWVHELKNAIWAAYDMNSLPNSTQHQPKVNPFSIIHEQFKDGKVHRYSDRKKRSMTNEDKVRLSYLYSSKCECFIH